MLQPVETVAEHAPVASLHESAVQVRPSLHVEPTPQVEDDEQTPQVAPGPLSQRCPVRAVHAVWLVAGVHCWHWFDGLTSPDE